MFTGSNLRMDADKYLDFLGQLQRGGDAAVQQAGATFGAYMDFDRASAEVAQMQQQPQEPSQAQSVAPQDAEMYSRLRMTQAGEAPYQPPPPQVQMAGDQQAAQIRAAAQGGAQQPDQKDKYLGFAADALKELKGLGQAPPPAPGGVSGQSVGQANMRSGDYTQGRKAMMAKPRIPPSLGELLRGR